MPVPRDLAVPSPMSLPGSTGFSGGGLVQGLLMLVVVGEDMRHHLATGRLWMR